MTINGYLRQTFPYFKVCKNHAWNEEEDLHIEVRVLNDHAVIEVYCLYPKSSVVTTCDTVDEDEIVTYLDENLHYMIEELKLL